MSPLGAQGMSDQALMFHSVSRHNNRQMLGFITPKESPIAAGMVREIQCETGTGQGQTATHAQQKKMGQSRTSEGALVATRLLKAFSGLVTLNST